MSKSLDVKTITSDAVEFDFNFPLHPATESAELVGRLLTATLDTLSAALAEAEKSSHKDVLQALAMALAIHAKIDGLVTEADKIYVHRLLNHALKAVASAEARTAMIGHA